MTAVDFLRAVFESPDDVGPRLVFADWLEERGDPRGEFIRVQVGLASFKRSRGAEHLPHAREDALRRRERELLGRHWPQWTSDTFGTTKVSAAGDLDAIRVDLSGGFYVAYRRGMVEVVALPLDVFMGACGQCGEPGRPTRLCPYCAGTGTLAAALALACPLREVRLVDREPWGEGVWYNDGRDRPYGVEDHPQSELPEALWRCLDGDEDAGVHGRGRCKGFRSRDAARAALSTAAVTWARCQAGLP